MNVLLNEARYASLLGKDTTHTKQSFLLVHQSQEHIDAYVRRVAQALQRPVFAFDGQKVRYRLGEDVDDLQAMLARAEKERGLVYVRQVQKERSCRPDYLQVLRDALTEKSLTILVGTTSSPVDDIALHFSQCQKIYMR